MMVSSCRDVIVWRLKKWCLKKWRLKNMASQKNIASQVSQKYGV